MSAGSWRRNLFFTLSLCLAAAGQTRPTVAFLDLENLGEEKLGAYCKALPAMALADLSGVKNLALVDRQSLRSVMKELALGESGILDEKTAPKLGNLMGAQLLVLGQLLPAGAHWALTWKLLKTETGAVLSGGSLDGEEARLADLKGRFVSAVHGALAKEIPDLGPAPKAPAESLPGDDFRRYGAALASADSGDDARAREILQELAARRPGFVYARGELSALEARLVILEKEREKAIREKVDAGPRDWGGFLSTTSVLASSMKYTQLLAYVRSFRGNFPPPPPGSPMNTGEMGLYYETMALSMLKRHEEALPVCEAFLKAYPASVYGTSVRLSLNQSLQSVKTRASKRASIGAEVAAELERAKAAELEDRYFAEYTAGIKWLSGGFHEEALALFQKIPLSGLSRKYGLSGDNLLYQIFNCHYQLARKESGLKVMKAMETLYPESPYLATLLSMSAMFPQ
ncbi:MAG: hypothetical protein J0L75_05475 [Spirochaetes bacterium]|nr:hypothetical protein [Spirochaetota bacterium]